jgi:hypothetical protein
MPCYVCWISCIVAALQKPEMSAYFPIIRASIRRVSHGSVQELFRRLESLISQCVCRRFYILDSVEPFTQLVSDNERACVGRQLAGALSKINLHGSEARAWRRDLKAARKALKAPADKWR